MRCEYFGQAAKMIDYKLVDWTKPTSQLAKELNCHKSAIAFARRKYAPDTVRPKRVIDWSKVDWSRSTTEIAKELGVSPTNLSQVRKKLAPETLYMNDNIGTYERGNSLTTLISPTGEELEMRGIKQFVEKHKHLFNSEDLEVKENKLKSGYVRKYNIAQGALSKLKTGAVLEWKGWRLKGTSTNSVNHKKNIRWDGVDWRRKNVDIAKELGVTKQAVSFARRKYALHTVRSKKRNHG